MAKKTGLHAAEHKKFANTLCNMTGALHAMTKQIANAYGKQNRVYKKLCRMAQLVSHAKCEMDMAFLAECPDEWEPETYFAVTKPEAKEKETAKDVEKK